MPKWGMTMTEGKIVAWLFSEGDKISVGDEIFEVETEKITNVVEAQHDGTLRKIVVDVDNVAKCGGLIALITDEEAGDNDVAAFLQDFRPDNTESEAALSNTLRSIAVGDLSLNVVTVGDGDGLPVVMLHGFGADVSTWMYNQSVLAKNHAVIAIDLPSHGGSSVDTEVVSFSEIAEVLATALKEVAPNGAHLVGHSFGGRIALRLAGKADLNVRSLSLIAPAGLSGEVNGSFISQFVSANKRRGMKAALQMLVADPDAISSDMIENMLTFKRIEGTQDALAAIASESFSENQIAEGAQHEFDALDMPVLVIWGTQDQILDAGGAEALKTNAEIELINDAGHIPHMEVSNQVNAALLRNIEAGT